jgi:succinate dehydrogenase / fumarate reductase flavoprotein subunit
VTIRDTLQEEMMAKASVLRNASELQKLLATLDDLSARYQDVRITDTAQAFNSDLLEALELGYLLDISRAIAVSALARTESRGAHYREDYPKRDDANWLKHTLAYRTPDGVELRYKPVVITRFQPVERRY